MSKRVTIKEYAQGQSVLFPESMDAYIDKVTTDFAIFAIAFNIGKMWNKGQKTAKRGDNMPKNQPALILILQKNITIRIARERQLPLPSIAA